MSSRKYTDNELESVSGGEKVTAPHSESKKTFLNTFPRIIVLLLIVVTVGYLLYKGIGVGSGEFYISDKEITGTGDLQPLKDLKAGSRLYFHISKKHKTLNANNVTVKIEIKTGNDFRTFKQITYEVADDFDRISSYIPEQYFKSKGGYRVMALIDNNVIASYEFSVN